VRTYAGLYSVPLGYDAAHLMTSRVFFAGPKYNEPAERERAIDEISARLRTIAGAEAATVSDLVPLDDQGDRMRPSRLKAACLQRGGSRRFTMPESPESGLKHSLSAWSRAARFRPRTADPNTRSSHQ
jgi:hypothetical protein